MAQTTTTISHPKHDIHKFWEIKPKLRRDSWISWKRELLATARDRGLYANILSNDERPTKRNQTIVDRNSVDYVGSIPLSQLVNKWTDWNNTAYNQILLCISPEFQTAIDDTDIASTTWKTLTGKFKSTNSSKVSIVWTKYENYQMSEGQSVVSYLTTMKEYWNQLDKMGETIADSTHTATIL